jgi:hypothetical protein
MSKKPLCSILVLFLVACLLGEMLMRVFGMIDFPIYHTDDQIGYIPEPGQQGEFLHKNRWVINDRSMGTGRWEPNVDRDILLIGDSIVWGGNMLSQAQKLGPLLEKRMLGWRVWPISAGSWSAANEVIYLDRNPDVQIEGDVLVWILNTGDFDVPSKWASDETHPRHHPASALLYLSQKYVLPRFFPSTVPGKPVEIVPATESAFRDKLAQLRAQNPNREMLFLVYPRQDELKPAGEWAEAFYQEFLTRLHEDLGAEAKVVEVREDERWNANLYRDSIHPSPPGNAVLADIIAGHLNAKPVDPVMPSVTPR